MTVQLLAPTAEAAVPLRSIVPVLGSVIIGDLREDSLGSWARARVAWESAPWCPLVVLTPMPLDEEQIGILTPRACSVVALRIDPGAELGPSRVRQALTQRRPLSPLTFAAYVALRVSVELEAALVACIQGPRSGTVSEGSRLRRRLKRHGPYTQRDWASVLTLCRALERCLFEPLKSQERIAMEHGMAPRTLSVWTKEYLQTNWREAVGLGAWEPILELALRAAGYALPVARVSAQRERRRISGPYSIA